ncbi:nascent polypeptide-associated complex subunit alpha, muscle-specific form isoform X2 [Schistocerca cancellata]|uniref:nascent polypeptide-associated complex subunit alpha, muscle-specific form isoform X2 n=1 Tax=Schistocerca cancellata TaxID=274614 RepID=UPI002117EA73|nr:nascent polypeptide-associated complex subunit alpha, muscle-specific form isoform X2 [Schistocerca cancellata]
MERGLLNNGAVGDRVEGSFQPSDSHFYPRAPQQPVSAAYPTHPQFDANYGYYSVNQESPSQFGDSYAAAVNPYQAAAPHHGMSYNNPQQSLYGSALSPAASAHYGSSNHGGAQYPGGGGGGQQWPGGPQQQLGSSPTPSPAHTPPAATAQYHHHHRQWPAQGPATGAQGPPGYYPRGAGPGPMPQHAHVGGAWAKSGHGHGQPGVGVGVGAAGATGPLFSLQLLVNQEMNRAALASAAAAGVGVPVAGSPGAGVPPSHQHQQPVPSVVAEGSVDLSADSYRRPLPLTHRPQQSQLQQQPLPLNGEVSKDTVSVIAQTPRKLTMPSQLTPMSPATLEPSRPSPEITSDRGGGAAISGDKHEPAVAPATSSPSVPSVVSGSAVMAPVAAPAPAPAHTPTPPPPPESPASRHSDDGHQLPPPGVQQQPQPRPSPSPSPAPTSSKDLGPVSPVRSPKSGTIKRTKKVDSILENLVESGTKKGSAQSTSSGSEHSPQTPVSTVVVAPASVIVSPAVTSEDSGGGRDAQSPSPGDSAVPQRPASRAHEDGTTSPTFNGSTDEDNGKPRRKRKLDKPVRVAKTSSDTESNSNSSKAPGSEDTVTAPVDMPDSSEKLKEAVKVEPVVTESETVTKLTGLLSDNSESDIKREEDSKPAEKEVTKEAVNNIVAAPSENTDSVESSVKSESVPQKNDNADDLLSVLNSDSVKSEPKLEPKSTIIDVETELEKMFAGIVEEDNVSSDTVKVEVPSSSVTDSSTMAAKALECLSGSENTSPSVTATPAPPPPPQDTKPRVSKRGRPKGSRNSSHRSSDNVLGLSSSENTPKKKKRKQAGRVSGISDEGLSSHKKKVKRPKLEAGATCDSPIPLAAGRRRGRDASGVATDSGSNASSGRSRGPVVHLEGPRDSPYSVTVVNGPARLDDDEGNDRKTSIGSSRRKNSSYHNDLEYRGKGGGGLFSSTLSARYDAHTSDPTWICVFCKSGPHSALGSGDLFGPYLVSRPERELPASADEKDIVEEQSRGGSGTRGKRSLRTAHMVEHFHQKMSKKAKRSHSVDGSVAVAGMTPVGKDDSCYEVWTHEECAVWAAGVHLVGTRIVGLQEAVWGAVRTTCTKCGEGGASLGCVRRGCDLRAHYGCAQDMSWLLEEENYVAKCTQHKITSKGR